MLRRRRRARLYQIWPDAKPGLRKSRKLTRRDWGTAALIVVGGFVGGTAATIWTASPQGGAGQTRAAFLFGAQTSLSTAAPPTTTFGFCHTGGGQNCVVDGDTFWMDGVKIRIADIDTPETHPPRCPYEADLGNRATNRLRELLNTGHFELQALPDRDEDRYGRKLRVVVRNGQSLGNTLVQEGLARTWNGHREPWC
jgi:endonuclease YncB( thermonuclease family)